MQEALPTAREKMGPEQRSTLSLMNAYAVLLTKQRQYNQAEKLFDETLKGRQLELGKDHPDTLETINGSAYSAGSRANTRRQPSSLMKH